MKKIFYLIILIIVLLLILLFKVNNNKKQKTVQTNNTIQQTTITENKTTIPEGKAGIISHKINNYGVIEVIIKNNTGKNLKQIIVKAECYDKDGNNLGTHSNGQYNINTTDKYKIQIYTNTNTKKYNLKLEY